MGRHSCCLKQKLRKGLWSPEEDEKLYNYITRFGVGCWSSVPKLAGNLLPSLSLSSHLYLIFLLSILCGLNGWIVSGLQRCGKSCRLRWINYLRPDLKRGMFSQKEEDLIISLHEVLGNRYQTNTIFYDLWYKKSNGYSFSFIVWYNIVDGLKLLRNCQEERITRLRIFGIHVWRRS